MRIRGRRHIKQIALTADRVVGGALRKVGVDTKKWYEYAFWRSRQLEEKTLGNDFYEGMFTAAVGLDRDFYRGKRILDVGCGPRGSLEWAKCAAERVGLDPLVGLYLRLGIEAHSMTYVESPAENMPFEDGSFDVVASFNALDHVDDVERTVREMTRVLREGGTLLLVVDIHARPTIAEPHAIPWTFAAGLTSDFQVVDERHLEKRAGHDYLMTQEPYNHDDPTERYGSLLVRAVKS